MYEIISQLTQSGVERFIGDINLGRLGYTDDLCLLPSTMSATQIMLGICEKVGEEYDVILKSIAYWLIHSHTHSLIHSLSSQLKKTFTLIIYIWVYIYRL